MRITRPLCEYAKYNNYDFLLLICTEYIRINNSLYKDHIHAIACYILNTNDLFMHLQSIEVIDLWQSSVDSLNAFEQRAEFKIKNKHKQYLYNTYRELYIASIRPLAILYCAIYTYMQCLDCVYLQIHVYTIVHLCQTYLNQIQCYQIKWK